MKPVLSKLIYASQAVRDMTSVDLTQLLQVSRARNEASRITGLLLYCESSFMQILEGDSDDIAPVYRSIERDARHCNIRLLAQDPIETRDFPDWSMGFEHVHEALLVKTLPGYRPATRFPLISAEFVRNSRIAETLLKLYRRN